MTNLQPSNLAIDETDEALSKDGVYNLGKRIGSNSAFGEIRPITNDTLRRSDSNFVVKTIENHYIVNGVQSLPPDIAVAQYLNEVLETEANDESEFVKNHTNIPLTYKTYTDSIEIVLPQMDGDMNHYRSEDLAEESPNTLSFEDFSKCATTLASVLDFYQKHKIIQNGIHSGNILWKKTNGVVEFVMGDLGNCSLFTDISTENYRSVVSNNKKQFLELLKSFILPEDRTIGENVTLIDMLGRSGYELLDRFEEDDNYRDSMTCLEFVQTLISAMPKGFEYPVHRN